MKYLEFHFSIYDEIDAMPSLIRDGICIKKTSTGGGGGNGAEKEVHHWKPIRACPELTSILK